MPSCLGLYIEENIIKYAKVSKDKEKTKIDSFGIKFYDKIGEAIKQIIAETYSYKTPISINLSGEMYNYFNMFSMLKQSDMKKAIETEFESYCYEQKYNKNALESRYVLVDQEKEKEQVKVLHISANKSEIARRTQELDGYKLSTIIPMPIAISNIVDMKPKENLLIVNIEEKTSITTIKEEKITQVDLLEEGAGEFFKKINSIENSYAKTYEVCKNTTIYTAEGQELNEAADDISYLEQIMPTLYSIVGKVKKKIDDTEERIERVLITGTGAMINNIDLYFQEYLLDQKCELLRPYFLASLATKVNIKDYIEVNSAIALAMQGLGEGIRKLNFKKESAIQLPDWLSIDLGSSSKESKFSLRFDLTEKLDAIEKMMLRGAGGLLIIFVVYSAISIALGKQIKEKTQEAEQAISEQTSEITLIQADQSKLKTKSSDYSNLIKKIQDANEKTSAQSKRKNAIPNLLNQIMFIIPETVQVTSISEDAATEKITIKAQATKYEQLGYFLAKIKADNVLLNVVSTSGEKQSTDGLVQITIEGELP